MHKAWKALILDRSVYATQWLAMSLNTFFCAITTATDFGTARRLLEEDQAFDLVLVSTAMPKGQLREFLSWLRAGAPQRPRSVVLLVQNLTDAERELAASAEAEYLVKPFSARAFRALWTKLCLARSQKGFVARAARAVVHADAFITSTVDDDKLVSFELGDLSASGAFMLTSGPLPVGTKMRLTIEGDRHRFIGEAEVVRVQPPDWDMAGGVGVRFVDLDRAATRDLEDVLRDLESGPA